MAKKRNALPAQNYTKSPMYRKPDSNDLPSYINKSTPRKTSSQPSSASPSALDRAMGETLQYGLQNRQNRDDVASTLNGGMTTYNTGDKENFNWNTARQAVLDRQKAIPFFRQAGLFDNYDYASNQATVNLASSDYLSGLQDELPLKKASAAVQDDYNRALAEMLENQNAQYPQTALEWKTLQNDLYAMTDENAPLYWAYADMLLNGGTPTKADMEYRQSSGKTTAQNGDAYMQSYYDRWNAMNDDEYEKEYARLEKQFADLDWDTLTDKDRYTSETVKAGQYAPEVPFYDAFITTVNDELERRASVDKIRTSIRSAPDYDAFSQYDETKKQEIEYINLAEYGLKDTYVKGYDDPYYFLNVGANDEYSAKKLAGKNSLLVNNYLDNGYDYLTEDELADYNYLYNTGRFDEAKEYLELLRPELLQRRATVNEQYYRTKAVSDTWSAIGSGAESIAQGVGNAFMMPFQAYETAIGRDHPYSAAFDLMNAQGWTRDEQLNWIANQEGVSDLLLELEKFGYTGFMGAADNFARLAVAGFNPTVSLIFAGAQGASGSLHDMAGKDADAAAKLIKAFTSGAYEIITEKIGLDALFDMGKDSAIKYFLSEMASELGEETVNTLAEDLTEVALSTIFDYESEIKNVGDLTEDLLDTIYQTAGSTLFMGAGGALNMTMQNRSLANQADMTQIASMASELSADTDAGKLGRQYAERLQNGEKLSINQKGALIRATIDQVGKDNAQVIQDTLTDAIENRLVELGEPTENAKQTASAISRMYLGETLSLKDRTMVNWSDNADQVVKELHAPIKAEDANRTGKGWVTKAKQNVMVDQINGMAKTNALNKAIRANNNQQEQNQQPAQKPQIRKAAESAAQKQEAVKGKHLDVRQVAFTDENGHDTVGEFQRVEKKNGDFVAVVGEGETTMEVPLNDVQGSGNDGLTAILEYANNASYNMSADQANYMITAYQAEGGDAANFIEAYEKAYFEGYTGLENKQADREGVSSVAFEQGKKEAAQDEQNRVKKASQAMQTTTGNVSWIGKVNDFSQITGKGGENSLNEAMRSLSDSQKNVVKLVEAFAEKFKVDVVLYESDLDSPVTMPNGQYVSATNTVYLDVLGGANDTVSASAMRKNGTLGNAMLQYLGHELTHAIESGSAEGYAAYRQAVREALRSRNMSYEALVREELENAQAQGEKLTLGGAEAEVIAKASEFMLENTAFIKSAPAGVKATIQNAIKNFARKVREVFAMLTGGNRESRALRELKDGMYRYVDNLQKLWDVAAEEMVSAEQGEQGAETVPVDGVQFSLRDSADRYDYSKSFAEQVDDWEKGNFPTGDSLLVGRTNEIYRKIGLGDLPMTINQKHVDYIVNGTKDADHFMGKAWLKKLPEMLENPVAVIRSDTDAEDSVVVILSAKIDGKQIIAPVYVNGTSTSNSLRIDSNNITSVFGKGNAITKLLADALQKENAPGQGVGIYYWKKSEARSLLSGAGLQLPGSSVQDGLIHSIFDAGSDVNRKMFTSQTETRQFKRWFAGSQVVNEDGSPKVVYHATDAAFTVFDRDKLGSNTRTNTDSEAAARSAEVGFWFSDHDLSGAMYANNSMPVYLALENGYRTTLDNMIDTLADVTADDYVSDLQSEGYDGLIVQDSEFGGTSYVVFDSNQIKSATDNVGTFDPQNPDIRYARRDDMTMADVRDIISGMDITDSMNETEKDLLTRYKNHLAEMQRIQGEIDSQQAVLDSDTASAEEKIIAENRKKALNRQRARENGYLRRAEGSDGFARLMATSRELARTLSSESAEDAALSIEEQISGISSRLETVNRKLNETQSVMGTELAKSMFDLQKLTANARTIKGEFHPTMSEKAIKNRLAVVYSALLGMADGSSDAQQFATELQTLAEDIYSSQKVGTNYQADILESLSDTFGSFQISEREANELKSAYEITFNQFKKALSPYIRVSKGGQGSQILAEVQADPNTPLASLMGDTMNDIDALMILYDTVTNEKDAMARKNFEGMTEGQSIDEIKTAIIQNVPGIENNSQLTKTLRKVIADSRNDIAKATAALETEVEAAKKLPGKAGGLLSQIRSYTQNASEVTEYYRALEEKRKLEELAEQKNELARQLKSESAQKLEKKLAEAREIFEKKLNAAKAKEIARRTEEREMRNVKQDTETRVKRIARNTKDLSARLVAPTDAKHIPQQLKDYVTSLLSTFVRNDAVSLFAFTQSQADRLRAQYASLMSEEADSIGVEDINNCIEDLAALSDEYQQLRAAKGWNRYNGVRYLSLDGARLENAIVQKIEAIMGNAHAMVVNDSKAFIRGRNQSFRQFADKAVQEATEHTDAKRQSDLLSALNDSILQGNLTPVYFFSRLNNEAMSDIYGEAGEAMLKTGRIVREANSVMENLQQEYHVSEWANDPALHIKTEQGHQLELTRGVALSLYATAKREALNPINDTHHLDVGGFEFENPNDVGNGHAAPNGVNKISKKDMEVISSWLTEEQKAFADKAVEYLSTTLAAHGNESTMAMYGYHKFNEKYYFPFRTSRNQQAFKVDGNITGQKHAAKQGFTISVKRGASTPVIIGDFLQTVSEHAYEMAYLAGTAQVAEKFNHMLNYRITTEDGQNIRFKMLLRQKYGDKAYSYLEDFIRDLNGGRQNDNRHTDLLNTLTANFRKTAVMYNLSVIVQQPMSVFRAYAYINPKYFANAFSAHPMQAWNEMLNYSGAAIAKDIGGYNVGMGRSGGEYIRGNGSIRDAYGRYENKARGTINAARHAVNNNIIADLPQTMDILTWSYIWNAVKNEQAALHPSMDTSSQEFLEMCGKRADDVLTRTQVYDSVLTRSGWMRSTSKTAKSFTAFMAEPTLTANMLFDAFTGKGHTPAQRARAVGSVFLSMTLTAAVASLAQMFRKDDDDRTVMEKFVGTFVSNLTDSVDPIGMLPFAKEIQAALSGEEIERSEFSNVVRAGKYISKAFKKLWSGEKITWKDVETSIGGLANILGLPAQNVSREMRSVWNAVTSDWSLPSASTIKYTAADNASIPTISMVENLLNRELWDDSNSAYYDRIAKAYIDGDTDEAEELKQYMLNSKGVKSEKTINTQVKAALKDRYLSGKVSREQAEKLLVSAFGEDDDDAYWKLEEWEYKDEHGSDSSFSRFNDLYEAVESGQNLKNTISSYKKLGYDKGDLRSAVTTKYKKQLKELYKSGSKAEYANLKARVLTAYTTLGYGHADMLKEISNWEKEALEEKKKGK